MRGNVISRRTEETRYCILDMSEKNIPRQLWVFEELAWKRKRSTINCICRGESGIILGGGPEAKHHPRFVINPNRTCQTHPERGFQGMVKSLCHPIL